MCTRKSNNALQDSGGSHVHFSFRYPPFKPLAVLVFASSASSDCQKPIILRDGNVQIAIMRGPPSVQGASKSLWVAVGIGLFLLLVLFSVVIFVLWKRRERVRESDRTEDSSRTGVQDEGHPAQNHGISSTEEDAAQKNPLFKADRSTETPMSDTLLHPQPGQGCSVGQQNAHSFNAASELLAPCDQDNATCRMHAEK